MQEAMISQSPIIVKQEEAESGQHPSSVATQLVNRVLHISVAINPQLLVKRECGGEQKHQHQEVGDSKQKPWDRWHCYVEEKEFENSEKLKNWFTNMEELQQYVGDRSNLMVQGKIIRVMVSPFQGKTKRVQICRFRLNSQEESDEMQAHHYLDRIMSHEEIHGQGIKLVLKTMSKKLLHLLVGQKQFIQSEGFKSKSREAEYYQLASAHLRDWAGRLEQKYNQLDRIQAQMQMVAGKMNNTNQLIDERLGKLEERIRCLHSNQESATTRNDPHRTESTSKVEYFLAGQSEYNGAIVCAKHETQGQSQLKLQSATLNNAGSVTDIREYKDQTPYVPSFIEVCSAYLHCFSFTGPLITLKMRPIDEQETRQIMLLTNLVIPPARTSTYCIKIAKSLRGTVSFGLIDARNRNRKYCKWKDNVIKISSKGVFGDGKSLHKDKTLRFNSPDTVRMNVHSSSGVVEWIVTSEKQEKVGSCTSLAIMDTTVAWVPFIEMKCIGDTIEWIQSDIQSP